MTTEPYERTRTVGTALVTTLLVVLLIVVGRVVQLQIAPSPLLGERAGATTSIRDELGRRGAIVDRRGRIIATSRIAYRLFLDPQVVTDPGAVATTLSERAGIDPNIVLEKLALAPETSRYVVISHLLRDDQYVALRHDRPAGVGLQKRLVREYPMGNLAASLVGKVGFEHEGRLGVEYAFENVLAGFNGKTIYARDADRRPLWVQPGDFVAPADGRAVHMSIDLVIQQIVEEELADAIEIAEAGGGRAVVLDPSSGEILAMADILTPRDGRVPFTTDPARDEHPALGRQRCVTDVYEPGSTFKVFLWSGMTELGLTAIDEVFDCRHGAWKVPYGRRWLHDAFPKDELTWREVLIESSNIGMGQAVERMTHAQAQRTIARFGFGSRTGIGLPGEASGIVTSPRDWSRYTQTSVAMGHEVAVTPVQLVRAFSVFARSGEQIGTLPYLTLLRRSPDEPMPPLVRVMPDRVVLLAREAMSVVGAKLDRKLRRLDQETGPWPIFGKSGTAQLPNPIEGGYYDDRYVSSFIAGAPLHDPRLVVLVVIDDPRKDSPRGHFGSGVAGPAVRAIVDRSLTYLGEPTTPDGNMLAMQGQTGQP
jgi:cell division protein FtsI (penicillin-binding protein 3)